MKCSVRGYLNGVVVSSDQVGGENTSIIKLKTQSNRINNEQEERCQQEGGMQAWTSWSWKV
jgi:hypothetical protein